MSEVFDIVDQEWEKYKTDQMKKFEHELKQKFLEQKTNDTVVPVPLLQPADGNHLTMGHCEETEQFDKAKSTTMEEQGHNLVNNFRDNDIQTLPALKRRTDGALVARKSSIRTSPRKVNESKEDTSASSGEDTFPDPTFHCNEDSDSSSSTFDAPNDNKRTMKARKKKIYMVKNTEKKKKQIEHKLIQDGSTTKLNKVSLKTSSSKKTKKFFFCDTDDEKVCVISYY
jgi:hypothetical protein